MPFVPPPFNHEALTAARLSAALSRAAVAAQVGVHRQRVHDWESGTSTPHPRHLPALAAAVSVRRRGARGGPLAPEPEVRGRVSPRRKPPLRWERPAPSGAAGKAAYKSQPGSPPPWPASSAGWSSS